ncbi:MAG: zf-HC2 domain-containing protein [Ardenticatenaceae bacterium]|nr:zf-HC2 domain-containing protein [Ardenticatenaceae bacterium]
MKHVSGEILNEYLDGTLDEGARKAVEGHLSECAVCRKELASLQTLFASLQTIEELPLAVDLTDTVLAALLPQQEVRRWTLWVGALQIAAVLVMAGFLWPTMQTWLESVQPWLAQLWAVPAPGQWLLWERLLAWATAVTQQYRPLTLPTFNLPAAQWGLLLGLALLLWLTANRLLLPSSRQNGESHA